MSQVIRGRYKYNGAWTEWRFNGDLGSDGGLSGEGSDGVGKFKITGKVDTSTKEVQFVKAYIGKHSVAYTGKLDSDGKTVHGQWSIGQTTRDDFVLELPVLQMKIEEKEKEVEEKETKTDVEENKENETKFHCKYKYQNAWYPFTFDGRYMCNTMFGHGSDEEGAFEISARLDDKLLMEKRYLGSHTVVYRGTPNRDKKKIEGTWTSGSLNDTFEMEMTKEMLSPVTVTSDIQTRVKADYYQYQWTPFDFDTILENDGTMLGSGKDTVGIFTIDGKIDFKKKTVYFEKKYLGMHLVVYRGTIKDNLIEMAGKWFINEYNGLFRMSIDKKVSQRLSDHIKTSQTQVPASQSHKDARSEIFGILSQRADDINLKQPTVNSMIQSAKEEDRARLQVAYKKTEKNEQELLKPLNSINVIANFLRCMLWNEHVFNHYFNALRDEHDRAYTKWYKSRGFDELEKNPKPLNDCLDKDFCKLFFDAAIMLPDDFDEELDNLSDAMIKAGVSMHCSGGKIKRLPRSFYKNYFVYNGSAPQLTDLLRCSFVFDTFEDLYRGVAIAHDHWKESFDGILRIKNRFSPQVVPFGYRDLMANVHAPHSKVVCELQFHHKWFYNNKKPSHEIYKRARLFELDEVNIAYEYAKHNFGAEVKNDFEKVSKTEDIPLKYVDDKGEIMLWQSNPKSKQKEKD